MHNTAADFPFSPDLLAGAALYKRMIALDPAALAQALCARLEPLGISFSHLPSADAASEVTATAVLTHPDMHLHIAINDGPVPLQRMAATQTSPFLQNHPAGFRTVERQHVSHVELRLGAGPMPDPKHPTPTVPDLAPEICIAILHRALLALSEQARPEALIWYPTDMMLTYDELDSEQNSLLPAMLFIHPAVWTPGCDDQGRRLTGFIADHAEGWLGKPMEIEPTAHSPEQSRAVAAYLLRQSLAGREALDDGARVPLGDGHHVAITHLAGDAAFANGRISVRFDPPFPAPVKQKRGFSPLHVLNSFGAALVNVTWGAASGVAGTNGKYSINASGTENLRTMGALTKLAIVIGFSALLAFNGVLLW